MSGRPSAEEGAEGDAGTGTAPTLLPELPALDALEPLAASEEPSLSASWWIAYQVTEHVFSAIARTDPLTGSALPQPLCELLERLGTVTSSGCRPFPHDRLLAAACFAAEPFERLLAQHRHRIVRTHAQMPIHRLREVDTRSLAWLARQPGRNVREKLSGRTHALGVKREFSADTTENRLLGSFARLLARRASERLAYEWAYDNRATADSDRMGILAGIARICDEGMRRSELGELPALARFRPNNAMLGDPLYFKVFRAWKWLHDEEDTLRRAWPHVLTRAHALLAWMIAARLLETGHFKTIDALGRVTVGCETVGIEVWGIEDDCPIWRPNPPLRFFVRPGSAADRVLQVRLALEDQCLLVQLVSLEGEGILREASVRELDYRLQTDPERIAPGRGVAIAIREPDGTTFHGLRRGFADLAGLRDLASLVAGQILKACNLRRTTLPTRRESAVVLAETARIGIELGSTALRIAEDRPQSDPVPAWTAAIDLPGETRSVEWLDGHLDRRIVIGEAGRSTWSMGDVLDPDSDSHSGTLSLVARRIVQGLATERALPPAAGVAYTIADAIDEFSQRTLRGAVSSCLTRAVPVWRSVAAAMAWTLSPDFREHAVKPGNSVAVVDTEFEGVTLTVLTARYDPRIERERPESHGIYWERKPPLPPNEQLEMRGWTRVLQAYAQRLVARAVPDVRSSARRDRIVRDLVRTGAISDLIERGSSLLAEVPSARAGAYDVLELRHDPEWLDREIEQWLGHLRRAVDDALKDLSIEGRPQFWLIVGGPFAHARMVPRDRTVGQVKFFREDKGWGYIKPGRIANIKSENRLGFLPSRDEKPDVRVHISPADKRAACQLYTNRLVEFDVMDGPKGPEARDVAPLSPLRLWWRGQRIAVSPHEMAAGARECLARRDAGCMAWKEWLPDLSLEVVQNGHYGELSLLRPDTSVDPFLGSSMELEIPETLTLQRGHKWYSLPLMVGRKERRLIAWEARLDSPVFPLDRDLPIVLKLSYRYGIDSSYELVAEPKDQARAPFARLVARWIRAGESGSASPQPRILTFPDLDLPPADWDRFVEAAGSLHRLGDEGYVRFLRGVTERCWSQGRSLATAPPPVRLAFQPFRDRLLQCLPQPTDSILEIPRELEILANLHEDAPAEALALVLRLEERGADDKDAYKKAARLLGAIVGDGTADRSVALNRLLTRLERHSNFESFDPALASATMSALSRAAWRHPAFITSLAAIPGACELLIGQCRRTLHNLLARVPTEIPDAEKERIGKLYARPYRDACELLLALLRLGDAHPSTATLRCGSPVAAMIAKSVRQLDARFCTGNIVQDWKVPLNTDVPSDLHQLSSAAFVLNAYLAEGGGTNLPQVAAIAAAQDDWEPPAPSPAQPSHSTACPPLAPGPEPQPVQRHPPEPRAVPQPVPRQRSPAAPMAAPQPAPTCEPLGVPAKPALSPSQAAQELLALRDRVFERMTGETAGFKNWHNLLQGPVIEAALATRCSSLDEFLALAELTARRRKYPQAPFERQAALFGEEIDGILSRIRY